MMNVVIFTCRLFGDQNKGDLREGLHAPQMYRKARTHNFGEETFLKQNAEKTTLRQILQKQAVCNTDGIDLESCLMAGFGVIHYEEIIELFHLIWKFL